MFLHPDSGMGEHVIRGNAQGTTYLISYVNESTVSQNEIDSIFNVIDLSLSLYRSGSLISDFNSKGKVLMDLHMKNVVKKAIEISNLSGGAFDITVKPLVDYWTKVHSGKTNHQVINEIRKSIGYRLLYIKGDSLISRKNGVKIDCNGIAQGYTVDVLYDYLFSKGIRNFLIELGGEIRCSGKKSDGSDWKVGMEIPSQNNYLFANDEVLLLKNKAVTTAGNYRKFIESGRKLISHIIDPISGLPVDNSVVSVTVLADDAMTADAWDDVFFVKGLQWTREWLANNDFLDVLMIYIDPKLGIKEYYSKAFSRESLPLK